MGDETRKLKRTTVSLDISGFLQKPAHAGRSAYFIVIGGQGIGQMYKFSHKPLIFGRDPDSVDILIDETSVSRQHAQVEERSEGIVLTDLDSTNGLFVNGERTRRHVLQDGDRVQIGTTTILKFSYQDELEEQFQQQLYRSATRDGLTGAFNKKFFDQQLELEIGHAERHELPLSLILLDLDHFKQVNDSYGHLAGDYVLSETSRVARRCIRDEDVFCRYGGEEFVVLLRDAPPERAFLVAERIRRALEAHRFSFEDQPIAVTASLGVASVLPPERTTPHELVARADKYLYRAKSGGRNRTESQLM